MGYWYFRNTYKHLMFKTLIYSIFLLIINKLAGNIVNYGSRGCRFESCRGHRKTKKTPSTWRGFFFDSTNSATNCI